MRRIITAVLLAVVAALALPAVSGAQAPRDRDARDVAERAVWNQIEDFAPRRYDVQWVNIGGCWSDWRSTTCSFQAALTNDDRWRRGDDDRRGRGDGRWGRRDTITCRGQVEVNGWRGDLRRVRCDDED